jgi:alpha-1,2-rhamnosyltransferase
VQTGIQRVVRNVLRHAGDVALEHGYDVVPVVFQTDQFRQADLRQVLRDKLQDTDDVATSIPRRPRDIAFAMVRAIYHGVRLAVAFVLPVPAVRRFLFAHPLDFGLGWCLRLPIRLALQLKRRIKPPPAVVPADPAVLRDGLGLSLDSYAGHAGNLLVLLDASWSVPIWSAVARFQATGGGVHAVVYDLVPITHSSSAADGMRTEFANWMKASLCHQVQYLVISRTVAAQLDDYLTALAHEGAPAAAGEPRAFYLGSELDFHSPDQQPRPEVCAMLEGAEHVFIVVGSIEPRKNHSYILDAFDLYWRAGGTGRLAIIGRVGWKTEDLVARVTGHPLYGKRLFLLRDVDDTELGHAYSEASALVIASIAEGFGLPIVEAFQRGLPVLCSDIAVFREIAEGRAIFFDLTSPQYLADALLAFSEAHDPAERRVRHPQPWLSWRESTEQLLDCVLGPKPAAPDAAHAA